MYHICQKTLHGSEPHLQCVCIFLSLYLFLCVFVSYCLEVNKSVSITEMNRDTVREGGCDGCLVDYSGVTSLFESTKAFYLAHIIIIILLTATVSKMSNIETKIYLRVLSCSAVAKAVPNMM